MERKILSKIACVILNYNDYKETIECVTNLINLSNELHIIIVDNASPNNSYKILKSKFENLDNVEIILNSNNKGYAAGNNVGFRYIASNYKNIDYVILMNPDTRATSIKSIEKLYEVINKNEKLAVVAPVMIMNGKVDYYGTAWNFPSKLELLAKQSILFSLKHHKYLDENSSGVIEVDVVHGSFFMIRIEALKKINFLDEHTFLYCEEVLLAKDLQQFGYKEAVVSDIFFEHSHLKKEKTNIVTFKSRINNEINHYVSRRRYCEKYMGKFMIPLLYIINITNIILISIRYALGFVKRLFILQYISLIKERG